MAPGSRTYQSPCVNFLVDLIEQNELAGQGPARKSNVGSNEAFIPLEALTLPLVSSPIKDLFTRFMKVFIETILVQALVEPQEYSLKARTLKTYSGKSQMDCYQFCQQYKNYFENSGTTEMNCILFATTFFYSIISLRWAQQKCHHKSATLIT